jgi:two-component system, chemotaxis family, chemotaxis protein CheY
MTILLIDDSKVIHAYLDDLMKDSGYTIKHAFNGEEGLKAAPEIKPDVVLLDWEMPGLQGIEVLEKLRKSGFATPILMLTTKNKPEDITRAIELGANEYVMKPFTKDILIDKLQMTGVL